MSNDLSPYALDPFGPSANPSAYVAREASERARAALERALDVGRVGAVVGPPGHGKTLLLRLLGGREEDRARVAYVPFPSLDADELFTLVLAALGERREGPPREALLAFTRELAPRGGVVILVDDANDLSDESATALASLLDEAEGALRIGLAAVDGPDARRVLRAFGARVDVVHLADGMSEREARRYVEMRLAYGGARPELVAAFDAGTIERLHRSSGGVPRQLNQVAQDVVRRAVPSALPRLRDLSRGAAAPAPVERDAASARVAEDSASGGPAAAAPPALPAAPEPVHAPPPIAPREPAPIEPVAARPSRPVESVAPPPPAPIEPVAARPPPPAAEAKWLVPQTELVRPASRPLAPEPDAPAPLAPTERVRPGPAAAPPPAATAASAGPPAARAPGEPSLEDEEGILLARPEPPADMAGEYRLVRARSPRPGQVRLRPVEPAGDAGARARGAAPGLRTGAAVGSRPAALRPAPPPARRAPDLAPRLGLIGALGFAIGVLVSLVIAFGPSLDALRGTGWHERPSAGTAPGPPRTATAPSAGDPARVPDATEESIVPEVSREAAAPSTAAAPEPAAPERVAPAPSRAAPAPPAIGSALPEVPPRDEPRAAAGLVAVSINATPWATVRVDGRELGETPLAGVQLAPGPHVFTAQMPDGSIREQWIEISPDRYTVVFE